MMINDAPLYLAGRYEVQRRQRRWVVVDRRTGETPCAFTSLAAARVWADRLAAIAAELEPDAPDAPEAVCAPA